MAIKYSKGEDQPGEVVISTRGPLMNISLSSFAPENLISRDGSGSPVPRQPANLYNQAESGAYLRDSSGVSRRRPFVHSKRHTPLGHVIAYQIL